MLHHLLNLPLHTVAAVAHLAHAAVSDIWQHVAAVLGQVTEVPCPALAEGGTAVRGSHGCMVNGAAEVPWTQGGVTYHTANVPWLVGQLAR